MKLNNEILETLNVQINKEFYSAYLYLSMASFFDSINLKGFSNWMKKQAIEEYNHGKKIYDYIFDRDGIVELKSIDKPKCKWNSVKEVFEESLEHERYITASIHKLVDLSKEKKDYATENFLSWFVTEQIEEESSVKNVLDKLNMIGENKQGIFILDGKLMQR